MIRIVYKDYELYFAKLLSWYKSFTVHDRSFQRLPIEMYKVKNELTPGNYDQLTDTK